MLKKKKKEFGTLVNPSERPIVWHSAAESSADTSVSCWPPSKALLLEAPPDGARLARMRHVRCGAAAQPPEHQRAVSARSRRPRRGPLLAPLIREGRRGSPCVNDAILREPARFLG